MTQPASSQNNVKGLLYVLVGERYCGYKMDFLAQNLSDMEMEFLGCKVCQGIMREASIMEGDSTCRVCSIDPNRVNPIKTVQNAVAKLEIKCPLLSLCDWKGQLSEAEKHLTTCVSFLVECPACKVSLERGELFSHLSNTCVRRKIRCGYCGTSGYVKEIEEHFKLCLECKITCTNNCGANFARKQLQEHQKVCPLGKMECPFAKYGCKAKPMLFEDLTVHKQENVVEHTDMALVQIEEQKTEIHLLRSELNEKEWEMKSFKQLDGMEWEIIDVGSLREGQVVESGTFYINNFKLQLFLRNFSERLLFSINRIKGDHDKYLQDATITRYKLIVVDREDFSKSFCQDGSMDYQLRSWKECEMFHYFKSQHDFSIQKNSILVRFYFDVNTQKSLKKLKPSQSKADLVRSFSTSGQEPPKH